MQLRYLISNYLLKSKSLWWTNTWVCTAKCFFYYYKSNQVVFGVCRQFSLTCGFHVFSPKGVDWFLPPSPHLSWKIRFNLGCHCLNYIQLPLGVFSSVCVWMLVRPKWLCVCLRVGVWVSLHNCVCVLHPCACVFVCLFLCWFSSFSRTEPTPACFVFLWKTREHCAAQAPAMSNSRQGATWGLVRKRASFSTNTND